ncbi:hypothetical protein H0H92_012520 [Tricholoma furcatifolium]|nr:hypothetical protein H0H92_012520 [Tricholoma furcatifolium]
MAVPPKATVGILGTGASGLITAQVLLNDGFDVQLITRDSSAGGVWARERVYPGLSINNVHGEFRFSPLPMPPPSKAAETGGRLSGEDMCNYMESFAERFLSGKIRFKTEIISIRRSPDDLWLVTVLTVLDRHSENAVPEELVFSRIVLCTGGCSNPNIPPHLSPVAATSAGFQGLAFHSSKLRDHSEDVFRRTQTALPKETSIVIVGGGKSAQDVAAYLTNAGCKVTVVFETTDAFLATPIPLPDFIRKSRHAKRFLHTTWLGSKIVHLIWGSIASSSLNVYPLPKDSPLRNVHSLFWGVRTNDEGNYRPNSFFGLASSGKIELAAPARVIGYGPDGKSVVLSNGSTLPADVVVLATGYSSSWTGLFDAQTAEELGINRHPPLMECSDTWDYASLSNPPASHPQNEQCASSIYRGLIPAKNINRRNFAINGAIFTTNNGYSFEVCAHWISSYFLKDRMRLPSTAEEALAQAERNSAWMRKRFPDMLLWVNESYSSDVAFWSWPQLMDELLEDMELPSMRSGGNWLTWPFKVIDLKEIANLGEERRLKRDEAATATTDSPI